MCSLRLRESCLALLVQPRFNRTPMRHLKTQQASCMSSDYVSAKHFLPGVQSGDTKNGMKLVKCWGNVNITNDMSKKKHVGDTLFGL